jgi:iron complex transport system permease protein
MVIAASARALVASLVLAVGVLGVLSLTLGPVRIPPGDLISLFSMAADDPRRVIVLELRLPRTVLAVLIGGILGLSGAAMQGLLRNPLAEPSLFGAPQMAALFAVTSISLGFAGAVSWSLPVAAMAGAFVSVALLVSVAGPRAGTLLLILAGLAIAALAGAGTALALNLAPNPFAALEIAFWLMGSLEDRSHRHVMLATPFILLAGTLLLLAGRDLRAMSLGEETAATLGVPVARLRWLIITGVALGTGASVAVAGSIAFIGLVAPHLIRPRVAHDPVRLLVPSMLTGSALLLAADMASRIIPATTPVKAGVLTALIGAPVFLFILIRERRSLAGGVAP